MKHHLGATCSTLAVVLSSVALQARDLEFSLSLASGFAVKPNLYLEGQGAAGSSSFVQTRFSGPWLLGGLHASCEVYKHEAWKFWAGAGYEAGLGTPGFYQFGQATSQASSSSTEILNGTAKYSRYQLGVGATLATGTLGEYGAYLWRRTNRLGLDGTLSTFALQGTALNAKAAGYASSSSASDFMLELSMGFVQTRPTFKTFERISFGSAFGKGFGNVAAADWQLDSAYNDRLRPTLEIRFSFGVRL
jgi:hypothetical protein